MIDEQGRLLGYVNLIDALAVLFALVVIVAGVSLFVVEDPGAATSSTTRYATLDLGTQPAYVAALVAEGDAVEQSSGNTVTITDVYSVEADDGRRMYVRVRITGEATSDRGFLYAGTPLRVGRDIDIPTSEYTVTGTITTVEPSNPNLAVSETDLLVRAILPTEIVQNVERGDEYRINGRTVATIRSISAYRTGKPGQVRAFFGITYLTFQNADRLQFGHMPIREGSSLPFETDSYQFEGRITRVNSLTQLGQETTRTATLVIEDADPDLDSNLRPGMVEQVRGETVARLIDVQVDPATVVLTSQEGNIYRREHPVNETVTMTVSLEVRETAAGLRFKGSTLRQGETIVLDFGVVAVEAKVVQL